MYLAVGQYVSTFLGKSVEIETDCCNTSVKISTSILVYQVTGTDCFTELDNSKIQTQQNT